MRPELQREGGCPRFGLRKPNGINATPRTFCRRGETGNMQWVLYGFNCVPPPSQIHVYLEPQSVTYLEKTVSAVVISSVEMRSWRIRMGPKTNAWWPWKRGEVTDMPPRKGHVKMRQRWGNLATSRGTQGWPGAIQAGRVPRRDFKGSMALLTP